MNIMRLVSKIKTMQQNYLTQEELLWIYGIPLNPAPTAIWARNYLQKNFCLKCKSRIVASKCMLNCNNHDN